MDNYENTTIFCNRFGFTSGKEDKKTTDKIRIVLE